MEVLRRAGDYPQLKASAGKLTAFTEMIDEMRRQADDMGLVEFYEYAVSYTHLSELYKVLKKRTQLVKKIDKLTITADRTICGDY